MPEIQISKHIVELQEIFLGSAISYDEGIVSSDAVLAAALWRCAACDAVMPQCG